MSIDMDGTKLTTHSNKLSKKDFSALIAIMLAVALSSLDTSIVNTALPTIAADLQTTPAKSIWVVNSYQLAVVAAMLPFAALGDQWGPRKVFLGGLALFTASSLACAVAGTVTQLTIARLLQGVGAAGLMSVNLALVSAIYPPARLGQGVGLNALIVGTGMALGPTVASLILSVSHWPWLFVINLPAGGLALYLGRKAIPCVAHSGHHVDIPTAMLTVLTFASLIFALGSAAQREPRPLILISLILVVIFGYLLVQRQARHPAPMLPLDLLRRPLFALSVLTSVCAFSVQGLAFVSLPFFFEGVLHRDPVQTGFLITPWAIATALTAPFAGRLSDRYPPGLLGGIGLAVLCAGMLMLAGLPADATELGIVFRMLVCGIGFGFYQSPNLRAIMSSAPSHRRGGASGMIGVARLLGQTSGAAMVALCLGLSDIQGARWALALGAGFAALASLVSFLRLRVKQLA
jgi:DHA2 family multidrug resistance protein-like MFS transporter